MLPPSGAPTEQKPNSLEYYEYSFYLTFKSAINLKLCRNIFWHVFLQEIIKKSGKQNHKKTHLVQRIEKNMTFSQNMDLNMAKKNSNIVVNLKLCRNIL